MADGGDDGDGDGDGALAEEVVVEVVGLPAEVAAVGQTEELAQQRPSC